MIHTRGILAKAHATGGPFAVAIPDRDACVDDALKNLGLDPEICGPVDAALRDRLIHLPALWRAGYTPGTVVARAKDLRRFMSWCAKACVQPFLRSDDLPRHVELFLVDESGRLKAASFKRAGSHMTSFLKDLGLPDTFAAQRRKMLVRIQNRAARERKTDRQEPVRLSVAQIGAITTAICTASSTPQIQARDCALVAVMSELLLRRMEICDLRLSNWSPAARKLVIRQSKTDQAGRGVSYELRPGTADLIEAWLKAAGLGEVDTALQADRIPLFPGLLKSGALRLDTSGQIRPLEGRSVGRILSQRGAAAGITGVSGHTLRRSVARILYEAGCSDKQIQNAGRWETVEIMRTYVGLHREHTSAGHLLDALTPPM